MDTFSRLTPAQRSNLVAYLDGELDDQETAEIESVLAHSAIARNDIEQLARTYDLLNALPRVRAPEEFTERTVATARLDGVRTSRSPADLARRAKRGSLLLSWTLAMLAASSGGYLALQLAAPSDADVLAKDFDVIQNLDVYREVDNLEFLQQLQARRPLLLQDIRERGQLEKGR